MKLPLIHPTFYLVPRSLCVHSVNSASLCALVVFFHIFIIILSHFFLDFDSKISCFFFSWFLKNPCSLCVCVMSKVAYRLSCESYMIPEMKRLTSRVQAPLFPVSCNKLALVLFAFPVFSCRPRRPDSGATTSVHPIEESTCIFMLFENKDIFARRIVLCE